MDTPSLTVDSVARSVSVKPDVAVPEKVAPRKTDIQIDAPEIDPVEAVEDLNKAVEILNETVKREDVALRFRVDDTLNRPVVTVLSEETGKVVRQLPQDEVLRAVKNIDRMRGILFEDQG